MILFIGKEGIINMDIVDYHIHSTNSFDGKSTVEETCEKAVEIGISEICFTEHFSVDPRDVSYGVLDYKRYSEEILKAREKFGERLIIGKGLEIGEPHLENYKENLKNQLDKMDLDFIIGSVHNIDGVKLRTYMKDKDKYSLYYDYFREVYDMVVNSDIDIVGHLDLMKRYAFEIYGNYNFQDYREIIGEILKQVINQGAGIEINGSGYENKVGEPYPGKEVLTLYRELGGEIITVGSDSHYYENLAKHNLRMMNMLKEIGFKYIFTYRKRKKRGILL